MKFRLIFFLQVGFFTVTAGDVEFETEKRTMPLHVAAEGRKTPTVLRPYEGVLDDLLKMVSANEPPRNNPLGLTKTRTIGNFDETLGMPLLPCKSLTIYEVRILSAKVKDKAITRLIVRFVPGDRNGKILGDAALEHNVESMKEVGKSTEDKTYLAWVAKLCDGDAFLGIAACGVAVYEAGDDGKWYLAPKAVQTAYTEWRTVMTSR